MYPNSLLFGGIFAAVIVLGMALGALLALKRGFFPSLVRLGMIVLCVLIALPLATVLSGAFTGVSENILRSFVDLDRIAQASPSTLELLRQLPIALIAPTLFVSLFLLLKWLTLIVFRFIKHILPSRSSVLFRVLGCVAGALGSLICVWAILVPVWGVAGIAHSTVKIISEADTSQNAELNETMETVESIDETVLGPMVENFAADIFTDKGDSAVYRTLTKFELNGQKLVLGDEVETLAYTASDAVALAGTIPANFQISDLSATQINALRALVEDIDHSELLRNIGAEWISAMASAWQNGEPFMGINEPAANDTLRPVLRSLYGFLATTNEALLAGDIDTFIDILEVLVDHHLLGGSDVLVTLADQEFVEELTATIDAHTRFRTTVTDLIVSLTDAWHKNETYLGATKPTVSASMDPVMHTLYGFLAATNEEMLSGDIEVFANLLGVFTDHGVIGGETVQFDLLGLLSDEAFIDDLATVLESHDRFRAAIADMIASIMRAWEDGNDYMGLAEPAASDSLRPMLRSLYGFLADTNESRIVEDIRTFSDLLTVLNAYDTASGDSMLMNGDFLGDLGGVLDDHNRFRTFFADWLAELGGAWSNDEAHLGMTAPQMGDSIQPMLRALFGFLGTTKENTIVGDLDTFSDLLTLVDGRTTTSSNLLMDSAFLSELSGVLGQHDRFREFFADWLVNLTTAWSYGTSYMDIAAPSLGEAVQPIMNSLFDYLATTNADLVVEDLNTFADLLDLFDKHDAMSDNTELTNLLFDEAFLADLDTLLAVHTRFRGFFAGWMANLTDAWANDTTYAGMAAPQSNALLAPVMKSLYSILATTNTDLINSDLNALADITGVLKTYDIFNTATTESEMANILTKGNFISDMTDAINRHERFHPLLDTITGLGLSAISSQLDVKLPDSEMLPEITGSVTDTLNEILHLSGDEQKAAVSKEVDKALAENNVDVPDGVSDMIAQTIINEFGGADNVTEQQVTDYLLGLYDSVGDLDGYFQ